MLYSFISKSFASIHLSFGNICLYLDAVPGQKMHGMLALWA